jgi:hypothetical protein
MSLALTVTEVRFPPLSPLMTILTTLPTAAQNICRPRK